MNYVDEAFKENGWLQQRFTNYQLREQQVEFSRAIQQAIQDNVTFVGEAPTGVGKSLAALIPAAEVIFKEDAKVVVVTSSIVLQEQYIKKDIPTLEKVIGRPISATSIKGRANYVCVKKANELELQDDTALFTDTEYTKTKEFVRTSKNGDFSEMDFQPKANVLSRFAAVEDYECNGKACPAYNSCHYYRERKKVLASQIVVCNYHYFFHASKIPNMLPDNIRVVIFDEGHEMASIALDFLEQKYGKYSWRNINLHVNKAMKELPRHYAEQVEHFKLGVNMNEVLFSHESALEDLHGWYMLHAPKDREYWTLQPSHRLQLQNVVFSHYQILRERHEQLTAHLAKHGLPEEDRHQWNDLFSDAELNWQYALEKLLDVMYDKAVFVREFFMIANQGESFESVAGEEIIYWIQRNKDDDVSLHRKPASPVAFTESLVHSDTTPYTPVIVSATLTTNRKFDYIASELGVPSERKELMVTSPFDLSQNVLWYLPKDMPAGNTPEHSPVALSEMKRIALALGGRTLCLFTSNKALKEATAYLRTQLPKHIHVLSQHETPKSKMIQHLRANEKTVLLGTRSFFTGVDIQGQHLSAVLIDKIPFPMIGDPVNDYLMNQANGFRAFTLPEAIVTMKQGIGRLNRTPTDKGIISVMDGRLSTANYKNIIFGSFDFSIRGARDWNVVERYIKEELCLG